MNLVDIKKLNREQVYALVYDRGQVSKQDIASTLGLSLPTVTQCVNELKEQDLITVSGVFKSTGGRKPTMIFCNSRYRVAIGGEIRKNSLRLSAIDLYGQVLCNREYRLQFRNDDSYCADVGERINGFIQELDMPEERVLGVGIAIQGLVRNDGQEVFFGQILHADGFSAGMVGRHLRHPCILQHDTEAAASYALWNNKKVRNALYFVLNENLGGAVIIDGTVRHGTVVPSGLVEHMILVPNGRKCYCGKRGCVEMYCSPDTLTTPFGCSLAEFFRELRAGSHPHVKAWQGYLKMLAAAIYNYQIMLSTEVFLSGAVAQFMEEADLARLSELVISHSALTEALPRIVLSKYNDAASGAALHYVKAELEKLGGLYLTR